MNRKVLMSSLIAVMAMVSMYGCGGSSDDTVVVPVTTTSSSATTTSSTTSTTAGGNGSLAISSTNLSAAATTAADVFTVANATTAPYSAIISGGFNYTQDKISLPEGSLKPKANAGGVNNVADGNVDLTWNSNGNEVTLSFTGVDAKTEAALQSNLVTSFYSDFVPVPTGQVISATTTAVAATSGSDAFKLTDATTAGYTATISGGFNYEHDTIAYPAAGTKPSAVAGGVNNVTDGNVDLTWKSGTQTVTIKLTGLDVKTENALQTNTVAYIYKTY